MECQGKVSFGDPGIVYLKPVAAEMLFPSCCGDIRPLHAQHQFVPFVIEMKLTHCFVNTGAGSGRFGNFGHYIYPANPLTSAFFSRITKYHLCVYGGDVVVLYK